MWSAIDSALRFLVDEYAFRRDDRTGQLSYSADDLVVCPSFNERDGFDVRLDFPGRGSASVYLGTLMGALGVSSSGIDEQVAFLRSNMTRLRYVSPPLCEDLRALRFWHSSHWQKQWGAGIVMNDATIAAEQDRLNRLRVHFAPGGATAEAQKGA